MRLSLLFLQVLLWCSLTSAEEPEPNLGGKIVGEESTVFDLYLSDTFRGAILARYTDDWFEIEDPKDLLEQLPEIKSTDDLISLLSGRIEGSRSLPGVGSVHNDLNTFRIILNLEPEYLPTKELNLSNRIADPEQKFSLGQSFRGSSSGSTDGTSASALNHRTVASFGKYVARLDGTAVQDQPYVLTDGSAGGIVGPFEVNGGYVQTPGQAFASSVDIVGVKLLTSDQIYLNQDYVHGAKLEVYIPSRGRVEFFRDGQLLSVQILDFGLQEVDTRNFPDGSYNIDIVITEDNGNVSRESRFYTKSGYLTVGDTPALSLAFGTGRNQLDVFSVPVYQAGIRYRALDSLEVNGNAYGTDTVSVFQFGTISVIHEIYAAANFAASNHGHMGISGNISGKILGLTVGMSGATTLNPATKVDDFVPLVRRNDEDLIRSRIDDISRERESAALNIFKQWSKIQLGVVLTTNRRALDPTFNTGQSLTEVPSDNRYAYGPKFQWRIFDGFDKTLLFDLFYLKSDQGDNVAGQLGFRYRFDSRWSTQSQARVERIGGDNQDSVLNTVNYDNRTQQNRGLRASVSNELRHDERSNSDNGEDADSSNQVTNQGNLDYANNYMHTDAFGRDIRGSSSDQSSFGVDAEAAFLMSNEGKISVSRPIREGAAIIVDLKSNTTDTKFTLLINGQNYETIQAGQQTVVGLQAYRTYKVSIRPTAQAELVNYDQTIYDITVFPGNIVRKSWQVEKIVIALGRLVDPSGNPMPRVHIRGTKDYVATEEDGSFQADLTGTEDLSVETRNSKCKPQVILPQERANPYFIELGDVVCR